MIHTDRKYHYYLGGLWLLLLAVIGLSLLALSWQPSTARAQDEETNGEESVERFVFEETSDMLTVKVDLSGDEGVMLKIQAPAEDEGEDEGDDGSGEEETGDDQTGEEENPEDDQTGEEENPEDDQTGEEENGDEEESAGGDELPRLDDADGQPVWQYAGPSDVEEVNCDSRSWGDLGYVKSAAATLADDNEEDKPLKASLSISLPDDASDKTWYCFRVPFVAAEGETDFYYKPYQLKEASVTQIVNFSFTASAPQGEGGLPGSVTASVPEDGPAIDSDSWQYVKAASADDCDAENGDLTFNQPAAGNNTATITSPDDAGAVYCFRVALADSSGTEHLYDVYQVRELIQPVAAVDDEGGSSSLWIALAIVLGLGLGGLAFYMIKRRQ